MPRPTFNTSGAENNITPDLNAALEGVLNESAAEPAKETDSFVDTTPATKKETPKGTYSANTSVAISRLGKAASERKAALSPILNTAFAKAAKETQIVAYAATYNEKVDFKKVRDTADKDKVDQKVSINLAMYKPKKPDRVIVRYPVDIISQIIESKNNTGSLDTSSVNNAMKQTSAEGAYAVKILKFSKKEHELYDWVNQNLGSDYIQEASEIFEPYYKFNSKGEADVRTSYHGHASYAQTGGTPGILIRAGVQSTKSSKKAGATSNQFVVDLTNSDDRELVVTYTNPGRPSWNTPNNTIYDRKYKTVAAGSFADVHEASKAYFLRFIDTDTFELKRTKDDVDKKRELVKTGPVAESITGNDLETFNVGILSDSEWWNKQSVEDWYAVENIGGKATKKQLKGSEIRLVERVGKTSKDGTKTTYSAAFDTLVETSDNADDYTWDKAVTPQIKQALKGAELTYAAYMAAAAKSASKKASDKAKSRTFIPINLPGASFEQLRELVNDAFTTGETQF